MKAYHFAGILLSGGASRRFGEPKAFYPYKNKPMFMFAYESLKKETEKTVIVSRSELIARFQSMIDDEVISDDPKFLGEGPLAGIYTAMVDLLAEWYVVLPCDMPLVNRQFVAYLKNWTQTEEISQCFVPFVKGFKQPMAAIYHRSCLPDIEQLLNQRQLKMDALLERVNTRIVYPETEGFHSDLFRNINTKQHLCELEN
ncbi:molybdenum cofactor guanylyltransferase [Scopulibacillus cellulosilyticus]|uniref:Probable molybdenum cofactor guanylyltransferase n=1 Tax=Scopulibacillus cellulosilyticus TaxID=2665665 RepID=A0ABW2PVD9_9BACL